MSEPTLIPGKTLNKLELSNVTSDMNGKKFTVVVKSQYGSVSSTGTLTVGNRPVITKQPTSINCLINSKVLFEVFVTGSGPLSFQWRKNGQNIDGATSGVYAINSVGLSDFADYDVVISNSFGSVYSQIAKLVAIQGTLRITSQPIGGNSPINLTVFASGDLPITYQWYKNGAPISGATSSTYYATSVGTYYVYLYNSSGVIVSDYINVV